MDDTDDTRIFRSINELNKFIGSSNRKRSANWNSNSDSPCMKLNFDGDADVTVEADNTFEDTSSLGSVKRKAENLAGQAMKRHRESVTGLGELLLMA